MSYDFQNNQGGGRPGFSASNQSFEGSAPAQPSAPYGGAPQNTGGYGNNAVSNPQPHGGGGYSAGGGSGYGSSGNTNSGWKGNSGGQSSSGSSGGGGWKGGGGSNSGGYSRGGSSGGGGGWKGGGGGGKGGFNRPQLTPEQLAAMPLPKTAVLAGNFKAPEQLAPAVREIGELLKQYGFAIRAGGMDGFDKIVADNIPGLEFHIPFRDFNQISNAASNFNTDECKEFAKRFLPDWGNLKDSHQAFFCKNVRLVLGKRLDQPTQIAIIWSEDGVEGPANRTQHSMHAGHIAAMCKAMHIPVINISNPDAIQRLRRFLEA